MPAPSTPKRHSESEAARSARSVLRGTELATEELKKLVQTLKREQRFGLAREVLARARDQWVEPDFEDWFRQQHALCTYKDPDLPMFDRLLRAEEVLSKGEDLESTTDQESLGLAGAIYKGRWEADGRKEHLEKALGFYGRGHEGGPKGDQGYNGINAAFVLDLLAHLDDEAADRVTQLGDELRERARKTRQQLTEELPGLPALEGLSWLGAEWYYYATLAEAHFGLGEYDKAADWLREAEEKQVDAEQWERQTASLQFATITRLRWANRAKHNGEPMPSFTEMLDQGLETMVPDGFIMPEFYNSLVTMSVEMEVLRLLTAGSTDERRSRSSAEAALSSYVGRVGLALSGGGFRASLYHIGVLARLAELDVLRHVEVLSCVSGGSIVGAHYYLEVRKLLESTPESEITRAHYIEIVKRLEDDFLAGVQKNVRVRVAAGLWANIRMLFSRRYSRTHRVGELYEEHLFSRVEDGGGSEERYMTQLFIEPNGDEGFDLKADNWRRRAKVPELVLNATTLNTGHNWQFTASWMGEPPGSMDSAVNGIARLRRMYYWEAPEEHGEVRLGTAVAASSCVPGLFEPIAFEGLYPDRTVRLVDGGVHDNQGLVGLLERGCRVLLISDASGQMKADADPSISLLGPLLRSNSIFQSRIREEQYDEIEARVASGQLRGALVVHMKADLDPDPVDWEGCDLPRDVLENARSAGRRGPLTKYGLLKTVQAALAEVRTDLDSFHDVEAYALMTSGYRMTETYFGLSGIDLPTLGDGPRKGENHEHWRHVGDWGFLDVQPGMVEEEASKPLLEKLEVSRELAFKAWRLDRVLKRVGAVLKLLGAVLGAVLLWRFWSESWEFRPAQWVTGLLVSSLAVWVFGTRIMKIVHFRSTLWSWVKKLGIAAGGFLLARIHLTFFDPRYLKAGRVEKP